MNSKHFNKPFACRKCGETFESENGMIRHRNRCENVTPHNFICELPSLQDDKSKSKKKKKKECGQSYESSEKLFIHKCKDHWDIKGWYCPRESCSGSFYARKDYLTHVGTENRKTVCHFAKGPSATRLKRYVCLACGRRFQTLREFNNHAQLFCKDHNNDKYPKYRDSRPQDPPATG